MSRPMYFDSHAHYDSTRFDDDRDSLLKKLPQAGVAGVINCADTLESCKASIQLAEMYPYIYAAVGIHPHNVSEMTEEYIDIIRDFTANKHVVAIGEIGLDYHYCHAPKDVQKHWFYKQLMLAKDLDLPVIIHSREAASDTMEIIEKSGVKKGVLHCYSGYLPMALKYVEMGFHIGIGGVVTYKNAKKTCEVAADIPLEALLIETDAPYLSPVPNRGKRNDSSNLKYVVQTIAEIRGTSENEIAEISDINAKKLFTK